MSDFVNSVPQQPIGRNGWLPTMIGTVDNCVNGWWQKIRLTDTHEITLTLEPLEQNQTTVTMLLKLYNIPGTDPDVTLPISSDTEDNILFGALGSLLKHCADKALDYQILTNGLINHMATPIGPVQR